jgi:hypothetical protein
MSRRLRRGKSGEGGTRNCNAAGGTEAVAKVYNPSARVLSAPLASPMLISPTKESSSRPDGFTASAPMGDASPSLR